MINVLSEEEWSKDPTLVLSPRILSTPGDAEPACGSCARSTHSGEDAYRPAPQRSGNLQIDPEIHLPGPMPLDIGWFYNASSKVSGPVAYGWTMSPYLTAQASGSPMLVTLTRGNGSQVSYSYNGASYVPQTPGCLNSLTQDVTNSYWKETTLDGTVTAYPVNTAGHVTTVAYIQDSVGNALSYTYVGGEISTIKDGSGRVVTFGYSGAVLTGLTDWAGRVTQFQHDFVTASPLKLLTTVIGPTLCQTVYQYGTFTQYSGGTFSSAWMLSGIVSPNGFGTSYLYDMQGRVTNRTVQGAGNYTYLYQPGYMTTIDPMGGVLTQALGTDYSLNSVQSPTGAMTTYTRNANLQETSRQTPNGGIYTTNYNAAGLVSSTVNPLGYVKTLLYDSFNNIQSEQTADGAIWTQLWSYAGSSFDTTGAKRRLQVTIDPLGNQVTLGYSARGQLVSQQDMLGFVVSQNYNSFGDRISTQDQMGSFWTFTRDLGGNAIAEINPLGSIWSQTFDKQNRPLVSVSPVGSTQTNAYDSEGNRVVAISPRGFRTSWTYNVFDAIVSQQDALGNYQTNLYDLLGRRIGQMDQLGNITSLIWSASSQLLATQNPLGAFVTNILDVGGRVVAVQNPLGYLNSAIWDLADRRIASVDPLGNRTTAVLDPNGRTIATQNPLGYLNSTIFSAANQTIGQIDANNNRSTTVFDPRGLPVAQIDPLNRTNTTVFSANRKAIASIDPGGYIASTILDQANNVIATMDPRQFLITTVRDAANRPIATVNAYGARSSTIYDLSSNPVQSIDELNRVSSRIYDGLDRVHASVSPLGFRATTNRDAVGRTISTQNALGSLYSSVFDSASRQVASITPLGYRSTTVFDQANQPIASQDSLGYLNSTIWDAAGRQAAAMNQLGSLWSNIYDAASQRIAAVNPLGGIASTYYLPNGWQSATQNQLGFLTSFIRDAAGQQIAVVDANSGRSTTIFTNRGYVSATQDQLGFLTSFTQDANGNDILRVDARNWPTTYTIDALNRTSAKLYMDGTRVTNTWDASGQQLTCADTTGTTSWVWDLDGRKTATQNPTGINLTSTLDAVGNRLVLADPYGRTTYTHDSQSRLLSIQNPANERTTLTWDALDREQHRVLGNGGAISHTFDAAGRETLIENRDKNGVGQAIFSNTYDALSNRLSVLELDGTRATFSYDATSQLVAEARGGTMAYASSYVWDPVGNRVQKYDSGALTQYTLNAANELLVATPASGPATTTSYDAVGNTTVQNTGGALTTQTWTPENRLSSVALPDGTSESYLYSDDGLRKKKTNVAGTTVFTWDESNLLLETDTSNALQARYTDYPGYWGGLASQRRGATTSYYGCDSQGSVRILVSSAGVVTDSYSYRANGEPIQTGSGSINPFLYVGLFGYYCDRSGVYYVRARALMAAIARWLSRDPIGFAGSIRSLYGYVRNSPIGGIDPSGLIELAAPTGKGKSPLIITPSCSGSPGVATKLSGCCATFLKNFDSLSGAMLSCIMEGPEAVPGDSITLGKRIDEALSWLKQVCSGKGGDICVWCVKGSSSNPGDPPKGWPSSCEYKCPDVWGLTPVPAWGPGTKFQHPPINSAGTGCDLYPPGPMDGCEPLQYVPGSNPKRKCAAIGLCSEVLPGGKNASDTPETCSGLMHELLHTGGILHGPGQKTFVDLIYRMDCCLCKLTYPKQSNCKIACDGTHLW